MDAADDLTFPEDHEGERSLLATLCAEGNDQAAAALVPKLEDSDFVAYAHQALFRALRRVVEDPTQPGVCLFSLKAELESAGELDKVRGYSGLCEIMDAPEVNKPEALVNHLKGVARRRQLMRSAGRIMRDASNLMTPLEEVEDTLQKVVNTAREQHKGPLSPLAGFLVSMTDLDKLKIPAREMIVEPFLPTSSLSMVFAARGIGKSWFVMELARAVTTATPFFEWHVPAAKRVLYIDGEMPLVILQERLSWLYQGQPSHLLDILPSEYLWMDGHPLNLNNLDSQKRVQDLLDAMAANERRPDLIILDNLSSLCSGSENENDEQDGILKWLMGLRHQGFAVLQVHHAGKSGEQRGASRREDLLDTSIKLTGEDTTGETGAAFKIEFTKTRGRKPRPEFLVVSLEKGIHGEPVWNRAKTIPKYMQALQTIHDQGPADIKTLGDAMGISRQAASKHVDKLREMGLIYPLSLAIKEKGEKALQSLEGGAHAA